VSASLDSRSWRPLKCVGGPLDGQRRRLSRVATELVEPVDDGLAIYRLEWRRPSRAPRYAVLRFAGLRPLRARGARV
jgi:hypothetical protein